MDKTPRKKRKKSGFWKFLFFNSRGEKVFMPPVPDNSIYHKMMRGGRTIRSSGQGRVPRSRIKK